MKGKHRTILIILLLIAGGVWAWRRLHHRRTPNTPLEIGIWYWHTPFAIPKDDADKLKAMAVRDVYVRAGTFTYRDNKASLIIPQVWKVGAPDFRIHLVFNFDYTIAPRFGTVPNDVLASAVIAGVQATRQKAEAVGVKVAGIQFDLDCPTKRLPKYAELLQTLRAALRNEHTQLSITALPTWFSAPRDLAKVTAQTDFFVPQYYEAAFSDRLATDRPISHLAQVESGLKAGGNPGHSAFLSAFPVYGHARLYDDKGRIARFVPSNAYCTEMLRVIPAFRLEQAYPSDALGKPAVPRKHFIGEELYRFVAKEAAENGDGKGYHIIFDLPTAELVGTASRLDSRQSFCQLSRRDSVPLSASQ